MAVVSLKLFHRELRERCIFRSHHCYLNAVFLFLFFFELYNNKLHNFLRGLFSRFSGYSSSGWRVRLDRVTLSKCPFFWVKIKAFLFRKVQKITDITRRRSYFFTFYESGSPGLVLLTQVTIELYPISRPTQWPFFNAFSLPLYRSLLLSFSTIEPS